jgi:hypothetical protein
MRRRVWRYGARRAVLWQVERVGPIHRTGAMDGYTGLCVWFGYEMRPCGGI